MLSVPVTAKSLRPGTVVMLQLGKAGLSAPDAETLVRILYRKQQERKS